MDVLRASASIDELIEKRAREKSTANELAAMYAESARRHRERIRQEHAAQWYGFHSHMQELHASLSEEHRVKAEQLLEEPAQ